MCSKKPTTENNQKIDQQINQLVQEVKLIDEKYFGKVNLLEKDQANEIKELKCRNETAFKD